MSVNNAEQIGQLPAGYVAVPISEDHFGQPITLCVLVRREPDPVAGRLVVVRTRDAKVYLGLFTDIAGVVQRWVEIWVQNTDGFARSLKAIGKSLTNVALDAQWNRNFESFRQADPASVITTGWEKNTPFPIYLDLKACRPVHPTDPQTKQRWQVCKDDAFLSAKGLPPYSTSLARYLYLPEQKDQSPIIRLSADSPTSDGIRELATVTASSPDLIAFNPDAAPMMIRDGGFIRLEDYIDFLSGKAWPGIMHGRTRLDLDGDLKAMADHDPRGSCEGWLFQGQHGRWGRLLEIFHLKLRLLHQAVVATGATIQLNERPILNLSADSFTVKINARADALPYLWTSRLSLIDPGDAFVVPVPDTDLQYFLCACGDVTSIYSPEKLGSLSGNANIRIRQVINESTGILVEGTIATQERLLLAPSDLVWIRLSLAAGPVDLYCRFEPQQIAAGEWRFRTVPRRLPKEIADQLQAASGVPITNVNFEVLCLRSSPVDLYSLAILAVRTLLVGGESGLPIAKDEILSLARQIAAEHDPAVSLPKRIQAIFDRDPRWLKALGPHRLLNEKLDPKQVFDLVPPELWWDTLAFIIRLFPGIGKDSLRRDFGDAGRGGLHKVVLDILPELESLMLRTRSLIVIDWRFNREINAAIRSHLAGLAGV